MSRYVRSRQTKWLALAGLVVAMGVVVAVRAPGVVAYADDKADAAAARKQLARLEQKSVAFRYVAKALRPSVVSVRTEKVVRTASRRRGMPGPGFEFDDPFFRRFFGDHPFFRRMPRDRGRTPDSGVQRGMGSGVIVRAPVGGADQVFVLTNNHVVTTPSGKPADKIVIKLSDKREIKIEGDAVAKQVLTDRGTDLAVIKIDATDVVAATLGDSTKLEVGDWVLAIGNPFGLDLTVTAGIVSAKGRHQLSGLPTTYQDFIQTDAAINPGNSGGPLVNLKGEVVGINTAIFSRSGGYMGIGFAIPSAMARSITQTLLTKGKVTRGYLGVYFQDLTPELAANLGLKDVGGVVIPNVIPDGPAAKAGIQEGDVLLEMDGKPIKDGHDLKNTVAGFPVGKKVTFKVKRADKTRTISVTMGERPTDGLLAGAEQGDETGFGLEVQDLTPELARKLGYDVTSGVVVTDVEPGGPAHEAGLAPGELIRQVQRKPVKDAAAFRQMLRKADAAKGVLLLVQNRQGSRFAVLKKKD